MVRGQGVVVRGGRGCTGVWRVQWRERWGLGGEQGEWRLEGQVAEGGGGVVEGRCGVMFGFDLSRLVLFMVCKII